MYIDKYGKEITKKLAKLRKKDFKHFTIVIKKIDKILENPEHLHKFLRYEMKGEQRIHIGHFILTFTIDKKKKIISFYDYDHHDNVYRWLYD